MTTNLRPKLIILAGLALALVLPWAISSSYGIVLLNQALIYSLIAIGLNFVYGFGGVFSLAQAAFWGIGAYTSALLTTDLRMPFLVGFLGAAAVTSLFGVILGLPTLKLRSHYLTMATLAFAESVRSVLMNAEGLTHGAQGIRGIPPASMGPLLFEDPRSAYYLHLVVVLGALLLTTRFRRSRLGRALEATRDDELAAAASGVNVTTARVLAFVLSALLAGIAGSLWAHFSAYISPETFDLMATIRFVSMLLIGGAGTVLGPLVGAGLLTYLPEWLRFLEAWYMAIYGLSIVVILLFAPRGLVGLAERLIGRGWGGEEGGKGEREGGIVGNGLVPSRDPAGNGVTRRLKPAATGYGNENASGASPDDTPLATSGDVPLQRGVPAGGVGVSPLITHDPSLITPLLQTRSLTIAFGGLVAVDGVGLRVAPGEIRGIIGPNGSGKTTMLNLISGIYRPTSGEILLDGRKVEGASPSELVRLGIARTFQNLRLFPQMTVLDNVKVATYCRTRAGLGGIFLATGSTTAEERQVHEEAMATLEFMGLGSRAHSQPGDLSYGQRRLVEIARALATRPRLLLLDEPGAGMSRGEKERLVGLVQEIHAAGNVAIIVIEHDMKLISGLCQQVTVLNYGKVIAQGTPDEVKEDQAVVQAYLGRGRAHARAR